MLGAPLYALPGKLLVGIGERKKDGISAFYVLEHNPGNISVSSTPIYGGRG
jgi:hypothetical protein